MLNEAERLWRAGWGLLWLKPKSKAPVMAKWTSGERQDWTTLKKSYRKNSNMGVRLGKASVIKNGFLAVIDCDVKSTDPEHLKEMKAELKFLKIPLDTLQVISGRGNGSSHYYIKTPAPVSPKRLAQSSEKVKVMMPSISPSRVEKEQLSLEELKQGWRLRPAWEISLMGEGQQVVLPPSIHPDSGQPYKWKNKGTAILTYFIEGNIDEKQQKETIQDFNAVPYDLYTSTLSDAIIEQITEGADDIADRSAALYGAAIAMRKCGFNQAQILSCLTDRENYLGRVGFDHAGTSSRTKAAEWVLNFTLKKAGKVASSRDDFEIIDTEAVEVVDKKQAKATVAELLTTDGSDWKTRLERSYSGQNKGAPKTSLKNLLLIFSNVGGPEPLLGFNEFAVEDVWLRPAPWGDFEGQTLSDAHCRTVKEYLATKFRMEPDVNKILEALLILSNKTSFHPVRDYILELKWDRVPRVRQWLYKYLGAQGPKDYIEAVGAKTLIAMIARIFEPGVKYDHVLILEGDQGAGKSSAARILSDPWFSDALLNVTDKDSVMNMQGVWVNELGELSAMSRSEVNAIKEFVVRQVDKIRPPYGRLSVKYPRQSVFIGTTNNKDYLKDQTGNRRFWPVKIDKLDRRKLKADRDQLIAEAYVMWLGNEENLWLNVEESRLAKMEQGLRMEHDELQDAIHSHLVDHPELSKKGFTFFDLIESVDVMRGMRADRSTQMRVAGILRKLGFDNPLVREKGQEKAIRKWRAQPLK